jgi:hypothetical protein
MLFLGEGGFTHILRVIAFRKVAVLFYEKKVAFFVDVLSNSCMSIYVSLSIVFFFV